MEHDDILRLVMQRARNNNVKFLSEKIQYRRDYVNFTGNIISYNTIRARRKYCDAILGMEKPKDRSDVFLDW